MSESPKQPPLSQVFEITNKQQAYSVILLPGDYLYIFAVNLKNLKYRHSMLSHAQLNRQLASRVANMKQLFSVFNNHKQSLPKEDKIQFCERLLKINEKTKEKEGTKNEVEIDIEEVIRRYKQKIISLCDQNKKLEIQLGQKEQFIAKLQIQLRLIKLNYDETARKLSRIQEQFKERQYHQRQQTEFVTQMQQRVTYKIPLKSIQHTRTLEEIKISNLFQFKPFASQFLKNFKIQGSKIKLLKEFKDFYQVSSESPLPLKGKTTIKLNIIQTKSSNIYFGVMNQSRRKEKFTCQHKQAISYKLRGGKFLYEDGTQTGQQIPWVKQGEQVSLMIDSSAKQVSWSVGQKYMIKRKLPESMHKSPLFVFVSLHDEGDEIQFT